MVCFTCHLQPPVMVVYEKKVYNVSLLILGTPGNDIDVFLSPLIDDLNLLFDVGVETFDAYKQHNYSLCAVVLWTINDHPALGTLSGCPYSIYKGCALFGEETEYIRLTDSNKQSYVGHIHYLQYKHPFRS